MKKKELFLRYIVLIIGLLFSAFGVALAKQAELGVTPISSVANIMSYKFTALSLGSWLIIWNCALIAGQIILLRKNFRLIQLLQIPLSFLFGWFTDLGLWCVSVIPADIYIVRLLMVFAGIIVLAFGISLSVAAEVIMNSGEAFVKAISDVSGKNFGNIKIGFDIGCVLTSVLLSLIFFKMRIIGTREGTVISAVLTGIVVKFFNKKLGEPVGAFLRK